MTGVVATATPVDRYLGHFEALERAGALRGPSWLRRLRQSAIAHVADAGFPTTRDEAWRYTNLMSLAATPFTPAALLARADVPAPTIDRLALIGQDARDAGTDHPRLVFVDGRFSSRLSSLRGLPGDARGSSPADGLRGVRVSSLAQALAVDEGLIESHLARHAAGDDNVFAALNTAFLEDGAFVHVPPGVSIAAPIELLFVAATAGALTSPRVLIVAGPGSRMVVIERHVSLVEAHFANAVTEIVAAQGAAVEHYAVQEESTGAVHVATINAGLAREAELSACGVTFGARLARTTLGVRFHGERGRAFLGGLYALDGRQHVDNHVTVDHAVPRCASEQLYKGILDGASRAVFNGRVLVRPDAQKTDARQTNKHLLLSDGVEVDTKPQLEIFADDVKCTHGAAEGQLAPEALFYLRSRGLGEAAARALLTQGFAREVVARITSAPVRAHVDRALAARLGPPRAGREAE